MAGRAQARHNCKSPGVQNTQQALLKGHLTQGRHTQTHTRAGAGVHASGCVYRANALLLVDHGIISPRRVHGGYGVHKTGTYRLRRGGSCTGMTLSQLSSPPYELFGTVRFEQQYTQHVSEQGEREQYKHRNVGSDQGRTPPQTALRQLLTEGRDKASSRRWSNVASAACVRAKRAPLTYLNLLLGRHGRTLASEAWAPRARHQKRLQNPVLLAREWPSPQQRERCAGGVALSRVNGHRLGPSAVAWTGCSTGHQGRCRDTGEGTEGAPHAHPRHPLLLPWRWWCEGVAAAVMP
jgi:hypothetical protein